MAHANSVTAARLSIDGLQNRQGRGPLIVSHRPSYPDSEQPLRYLFGANELTLKIVCR